MTPFETLPPGSMVITLLGAAMIGGAIGSFLNVVIYRVPAGLSLIHPPSRCPRCKHHIRSYDNIPIFGWILLRGKCRDCGEPISARYPTIEAIVAILFVAITWFEWFGPMYAHEPSVSSPITTTTMTGMDNTTGMPGEVDTFWGKRSSFEPFVARAGLHLMLLVTLLGVGMIEWDRGRVPRSIWLPTIVTSILLYAYIQNITIRPAWNYDKPTALLGLLDGLIGAGVGLVVGVLFLGLDRLRTVAVPEKPSKAETRPRRGSVALLPPLCIGLVLGWQAVALVGLFYLPILLIGVLLERKKVLTRPLPHGLAFLVLTILVITF